VYARRSEDQVLTFDFGYGLINDNLLLTDRETRSVWSQLTGRAVSGPLTGRPLEVIPSLQTTWGLWLAMHPTSRVMIDDDETGRPYIYRTWMPGEPRPDEPSTTHDTANLGLGLAFGDEALYLPFEELDKLPAETFPMPLEVGGQALRIHYRATDYTAWAEDPNGNLLPTVLAYNWGWSRFHPDTATWSAER